MNNQIWTSKGWRRLEHVAAQSPGAFDVVLKISAATALTAAIRALLRGAAALNRHQVPCTQEQRTNQGRRTEPHGRSTRSCRYLNFARMGKWTDLTWKKKKKVSSKLTTSIRTYTRRMRF